MHVLDKFSIKNQNMENIMVKNMDKESASICNNIENENKTNCISIVSKNKQTLSKRDSLVSAI